MAIPATIPTIVSQGPVPKLESAQKPRAIEPMVGTNMRHVVSAISASNKTTVDFSGGGGVSSRGLCDVLIYLYTIPKKEVFA
ncbi:MAG: hypothetical protein JWO61_419 [Candidatus Saccharibacteria bacterium]|nr:hypothetical protein [Candidatus Saccharibacteria bacterium]